MYKSHKTTATKNLLHEIYNIVVSYEMNTFYWITLLVQNILILDAHVDISLIFTNHKSIATTIITESIRFKITLSIKWTSWLNII